MHTLLLFLLPALVFSNSSELRLGVSDITLQGALPLFQCYLQDSYPDFSLKDFDYTFGYVTISCYNVRGSLNFEDFSGGVKFSQPGVINLYLSNVILDLDFDYVATFGTSTKESGTGSAVITSQDFTLAFSIYNLNGSPQVQLDEVAITIQSITFNSEMPENLNTEMVNLVNADLELIAASMQQYLNSEVKQLNEFLAMRPYLYYISECESWLDMSLVDNVQLEGIYLSVPLKGQLLNVKKQPYSAFDGMSFPQMTSGMGLAAQVSDALLSDYLSVYWGKFSNSYSSLPSGLPIQLNTTGLAILFPQLAKQYGKGKPVIVQVSQSSNWPGVAIHSNNKLNVTLGTLMQFYVNTTSLVHVLDLHTQFNALMTYNWTNYAASFKIISIDALNTNVTFSTIGTIKTKPLLQEMKQVIKLSMPLLNNYFNSVKVPMLKLPGLVVSKDKIAANVEFTTLQAQAAPA